MVSALGTALLIRWMTFYAGNSAEDSIWFVPLMYIVPLAAGGLCIHQLVSNKRLDIPMTGQEKLQDLLVRLRLVRRDAEGGQPS